MTNSVGTANLRVLLVEDETSIMEMMRMLLNGPGIKAVEARKLRDVQGVIEQAKREGLDIVACATDMDLNEKGTREEGLEVRTLVRQLCPGIPVLVHSSSFGMDDDKKYPADQRFGGYFEKPVGGIKLAKELTRIVLDHQPSRPHEHSAPASVPQPAAA